MKKIALKYLLIELLFLIIVISGCNRNIGENLSKNPSDTTFKSEEDRLDYYRCILSNIYYQL